MDHLDSLEWDGVVDWDQAMLESVVGMGAMLLDPLLDEEVALLSDLDD